MMEWLDSIKKLKKAKGWTNEELAEKSGVSLGTLNKLLSGATADPKLCTLEALAAAFDCSLDKLLGRDVAVSAHIVYREIFNKYAALDQSGRDAADYVIRREYARFIAERDSKIFSTDTPAVRELPLFDIAASAGTGSYMGDSVDSELINVYCNRVTERASFAVRITGNSMEPVYRDSDILLIEETQELKPGELGVFVIDGESYFKKFGGDRLISLNPEYRDIPLPPSGAKLCGRVIGRLRS